MIATTATKMIMLEEKGVAGDDLTYDASENGYGGTVKLDGGDSPYFFLVKLKKLGSKNY
jgi:hypothetical protein